MSILFTPYKIGRLEITNRFVSSATVECLTDSDNHLTEKYYKVYNRLAAGNVGLIIPGNYFVSKSGRAVDNVMVIDTDSVIEELQKLTSIVHDHGAKIVAQLNHGGRQCPPELIGMQPLSASSVRDKLTGIKPVAMTEAQIETIIEDFVNAARRIKLANFDGVQIHAAHGYLINQFLSTHTNRRNDKWGGSLENRMRFLVDIYQKIRAEVGKDFPILLKLNSDDQHKNGLNISESILIAKKLENLGIDAIEVSGGIKETGFTITKGDIPKKELFTKLNFIKRLFFPLVEKKLTNAAKFSEGYFSENAYQIKQSVNIPIISVGGYRSKSFMEKILEQKHADFISMSRPFIRQPNLVKQMEKNTNKEIITCQNCNKCTVEITINYKPLKCYLTN